MADEPDETTDLLDDEAVEGLLAHFEELLGRVEQFPGPTADAAVEAVQCLAEIYGEALSRLMAQSDPALVDRLADDQLVGHLLALHGLHPEPVEDRVNRALMEVGTQLGDDDAVQLTSIDAGVATIRVAANGCGSAGLTASVTDVVLAAAPELSGVDPVSEQSPGSETLIPVESLLQRPGAPG